MFHKLEYELLLNEINEQKAVLIKNHHLLEHHLNSTYHLKQRHINILQKSKYEYLCSEIAEEKTNYQNYSQRRRREMKKKHSNEVKQHPKNLKQQQLNIRKEYKNQYNVQNKEYKLYKEKILNTTPKDQVREKLERIKDEQNRKFSLLYEHYKKNVDSVYQEQNLKLNSGQQIEQDQLNEDLERQLKVLDKSHVHRKKHQSDIFAKELEQLDAERNQKHKDLTAKMESENEDFEKSSKHRLNKLSEMQRILIENFDKECADKYGLQMQQQNNRYSMYNMNSPKSSSINHFNNNNPHLSYFGIPETNNADSVLSTSKEFSAKKNSNSKSSNILNSSTSSAISSSSLTGSSTDQVAKNHRLSYLQPSQQQQDRSSEQYYQPQYHQYNQYAQASNSQQQTFYNSQPQPAASYYLTPSDLNLQSHSKLPAPQQQSMIYTIDPYLSQLNSNSTGIGSPSTSLSYTSSSSSAQNSNRRNSTAFS